MKSNNTSPIWHFHRRNNNNLVFPGNLNTDGQTLRLIDVSCWSPIGGYLCWTDAGSFCWAVCSSCELTITQFSAFRLWKNKTAENWNRINDADNSHALTYLFTPFRFSIHFVNLIRTLLIGTSCSTILLVQWHQCHSIHLVLCGGKHIQNNMSEFWSVMSL